jgi:hypothetical protein
MDFSALDEGYAVYKVFTLSPYSTRKLSYFSSLSHALTLCRGRLANVGTVTLKNLGRKTPLACGTQVRYVNSFNSIGVICSDNKN